MHVSVVETLENISPSDWNNLSDGTNPFIRHEFLSALDISFAGIIPAIAILMIFCPLSRRRNAKK